MQRALRDETPKSVVAARNGVGRIEGDAQLESKVTEPAFEQVLQMGVLSTDHLVTRTLSQLSNCLLETNCLSRTKNNILIYLSWRAVIPYDTVHALLHPKIRSAQFSKITVKC